MSNDFANARQMVEAYLRTLETQPGGVPYTILDERIREDEEGWYFPYQSTSFVMTGNFSDSLVGNWPIFFRRSDSYIGPRRPGMALPPLQDQSQARPAQS